MSDLLIITNSYDMTTDLLLDRMPDQNVLRLNFDQLALYHLLVDQSGFEVSDPIGRTITSHSVQKAYWRKPFNGPEAEADHSAKYVASELRYLLSEIVNLLWMDQKFVLVEPHAEQRTGKLVQLKLARHIFNVPTYHFLLNRKPASGTSVVKSL